MSAIFYGRPFVIGSISGDIARFRCATKACAALCLTHRCPVDFHTLAATCVPVVHEADEQISGSSSHACVQPDATRISSRGCDSRANRHAARRIPAHCKFNGPRPAEKWLSPIGRRSARTLRASVCKRAHSCAKDAREHMQMLFKC